MFAKKPRFISFQNATIRISDISAVNKEPINDGAQVGPKFRVSLMIRGSGVMTFNGLSQEDSDRILDMVRTGMFKSKESKE